MDVMQLTHVLVVQGHESHMRLFCSTKWQISCLRNFDKMVVLFLYSIGKYLPNGSFLSLQKDVVLLR